MATATCSSLTSSTDQTKERTMFSTIADLTVAFMAESSAAMSDFGAKFTTRKSATESAWLVASKHVEMEKIIDKTKALDWNFN
eukprot:15364399-Ditylum_brightwellii.AAC.1